MKHGFFSEQGMASSKSGFSLTLGQDREDLKKRDNPATMQCGFQKPLQPTLPVSAALSHVGLHPNDQATD